MEIQAFPDIYGRGCEVSVKSLSSRDHCLAAPQRSWSGPAVPFLGFAHRLVARNPVREHCRKTGDQGRVDDLRVIVDEGGNRPLAGDTAQDIEFVIPGRAKVPTGAHVELVAGQV